MSITMNMFGELAVFRGAQVINLPASKRMRALLAYLAITARPHRRDRLCEVFWDIPDDPRGALRWSLSKIRPLVNDETTERLAADRERVSLLTANIEIDIHALTQKATSIDLPATELIALADQLTQPFLDGIDLPDQEPFQRWLGAERQEVNRLRSKALARLSFHPDISSPERLNWTRAWHEIDPFNPKAASQLLSLLESLGFETEA